MTYELEDVDKTGPEPKCKIALNWSFKEPKDRKVS